jgi:hypothetical protein
MLHFDSFDYSTTYLKHSKNAVTLALTAMSLAMMIQVRNKHLLFIEHRRLHLH